MQITDGYSDSTITKTRRDLVSRISERRRNDNMTGKFGLRRRQCRIQTAWPTTHLSQKPLAVESKVSLSPYLTHDHESSSFSMEGQECHRPSFDLRFRGEGATCALMQATELALKRCPFAWSGWTPRPFALNLGCHSCHTFAYLYSDKSSRHAQSETVTFSTTSMATVAEGPRAGGSSGGSM